MLFSFECFNMYDKASISYALISVGFIHQLLWISH